VLSTTTGEPTAALRPAAGRLQSGSSGEPAARASAQAECKRALSKGQELQNAGKYREALRYYEKALELGPKAFGKDSEEMGYILLANVVIHSELHQYAQAEPLMLRSLGIVEATSGKDHPDTARRLTCLGELYSAMGEHAKAEAACQRALPILEAKLGKNHLDVADCLVTLATLYTKLGQFAKAEPLCQRDVQIREAKLGKDHINIAASLMNLADLYKETGRYTQAEPLYQRSLHIYETKRGKDHPDVATPLNNLAVLYYRMGQYTEAEPLYQRSLHIYETKLGEDHPNVAGSLTNLVGLYDAMGQYAKAQRLAERALQIREAKLDKDHPEVAQSLLVLGNMHARVGDYTKAEPLYQRSLAILEAKLGKDDLAVAECLNNLALLYVYMRQYDKAQPLYERSLQIDEAKLGKDHPDVAMGLCNLGALHVLATGQYAKAEALYLRGLQIVEAKLGKEHPLVADTLNYLFLLRMAQEKWTEAARLANRQRQIVRGHVRHTLQVLSDHEQLEFLQNKDAVRLHSALSLGLMRRTDPELALASAGWLLNAKAVAQECLSERTRLALASTDPQTGKLASQLSSVRQQLAALTLKMPGQKALLDQVASLTEQEQQLARKLGQLLGQPSRADPWVTVEEVRQALPKDGILIDIARIWVRDFKAKTAESHWKGGRYAAWLIPPAGQGDLLLVDLGDAEKIDSAVDAVRKGLLAAQASDTQKSSILQKGEPDAEKDLRPALAALAQLVLEPLREQIGKRPQWLISPDGALWLVPWAALPLDDKTYVIEKHTVRYLVSGRDLVMRAFEGKGKRDESVLMADPDFDIEPKEAATLTAKLLGKQLLPSNARPLAARDDPLATRSGSAIGRVSRLPGTASEAVAIKPKLQAYADEEPWMYRGKNALEGVFKAFHGPKVVVLSTHGFFLDDQEFKDPGRAGLDGENGRLLTKKGNLPENPLLRCGLLLAGCNESDKAKPGQEDGVLTGLEIVGCDLRGTELVVLSACETGLGQVRNGEGVAGLRQAFQLAGAQTVVASLWQVSDRDTALLMTDFFDGLARGKSKAEALRDAQLTRIKAHRDSNGAAHPFFWAAFTVTGK
jgi:CHAT domain-containing protein